jgi:hypothetical protein
MMSFTYSPNQCGETENSELAQRPPGTQGLRQAGGRPALLVSFPHFLFLGDELGFLEVLEHLLSDFQRRACVLDGFHWSHRGLQFFEKSLENRL